MDAFVKLENFSKVVPYKDLFVQGLQVTILLSLCTVIIGFALALILAVDGFKTLANQKKAK